MPRSPAVSAPEVVEAEWGAPEGVALIDALLVDLGARYAKEATAADPPPPPDAGPAPASAPTGDPRWAVAGESLVRPRGAFVIARFAGRPVGCGALRPLPGGPEGIGEIKRMYTAPGARGRGVGRAVLSRLVSVATDLGYTGLVLETGTRQAEAMALYRSAGWHPISPYGKYADEALSRSFALDLTAADPRSLSPATA
ncbi:GNAT family N-acetyltransferase [Iamia sp.]|uniref:GNAT family N-acetyltransferase n=1 Tax=Iamia sp. TaxID=2722710 RepID=UPI002CDB975D|nr:GNAT family N-acetyltransferase [Iamia sp.]HXH56941.1 GNAT family N-acetyltransferase [Iamia sp.]